MRLFYYKVIKFLSEKIILEKEVFYQEWDKIIQQFQVYLFMSVKNIYKIKIKKINNNNNHVKSNIKTHS